MLVFGTFSINWSGLCPRSTFPIAVMIRTMVCRLRHRTGTSHECPGAPPGPPPTTRRPHSLDGKVIATVLGKLVCQPLYNFEGGSFTVLLSRVMINLLCARFFCLLDYVGMGNTLDQRALIRTCQKFILML